MAKTGGADAAERQGREMNGYETRLSADQLMVTRYENTVLVITKTADTKLAQAAVKTLEKREKHEN